MGDVTNEGDLRFSAGVTWPSTPTQRANFSDHVFLESRLSSES